MSDLPRVTERLVTLEIMLAILEALHNIVQFFERPKIGTQFRLWKKASS